MISLYRSKYLTVRIAAWIMMCIVVGQLLMSGFSGTKVLADTADTDNNAVTGNTATGDNMGDGGVFTIDNNNCFEGMERAYSKGYSPKVSKGYVTLVLPLTTKSVIKDNVLRASLNLGETQGSPFVYKNYNKNIYLQKNKISGSARQVEGFLVCFKLKLKKKRFNGSYPVTVHLSAMDKQQNSAEQDFTIYVTIRDGKNQDETQPETEPATESETSPEFEPKVIVKAYKFSKKNISAGDEITAKVTLLNTNKSESVRNLTVTASAENEFIRLTGKTDTVFVASIGAGGTKEISFKYKIGQGAQPGQYDLTLTMAYADSKGTTYTQTGKVKTNVGQKSRIKFDKLSIPQEAEIGDTIQAQVNAMNLGKGIIYNVRAVIEADGLTPAGTIYIGNIEAGAMGSATTEVLVGGLKNGSSSYGVTNGTVTFYYEDVNGKEKTKKQEFSVKITSVKAAEKQDKTDNPNQWWVIILAIVIVIAGIGGVTLFNALKKKKIG